MANLIKMRSMTVRSSTPNEWLFVVIVIIGYPVAIWMSPQVLIICCYLLPRNPQSDIPIGLINTKLNETLHFYTWKVSINVFLFVRGLLLLLLIKITWITSGGKSLARTINELGVTVPLPHVMCDATNQPTLLCGDVSLVEVCKALVTTENEWWVIVFIGLLCPERAMDDVQEKRWYIAYRE